MIDNAERERQAFAKRLNSSLDALDVPIRGRTSWLQHQWLIHTGEKLSVPTFRKWLEAQAMPKSTRMNSLAEILDVDFEYLITGKSRGENTTPDHTIKEDSAMYDQGKIKRLAERPPLNVEMLEECIEDLEVVIERNNEQVSPKDKAAIITSMYVQRTLQRDGETMPTDATTALAMVIGHAARQ